MRTTILVPIMASLLCVGGCAQEKTKKDRSQASEMFARICSLTKEYTKKLEEAPDSADWAATCSEFEDKLDKISFSYPPDTDLLLTEGQNDTIHTLMQEYVKARGERIHGILHPIIETDTLAADSAAAETVEITEGAALKTQAGSGDASRSHGN